MAEYGDVIKQFKRMCWNYQQKRECPMACPMKGMNISECRKIAFEEPKVTEQTVMKWAAEHPEPVYPTWGKWLEEMGLIKWHNNGEGEYSVMVPTFKMCISIPADIAQRLGIEPKEGLQ